MTSVTRKFTFTSNKCIICHGSHFDFVNSYKSQQFSVHLAQIGSSIPLKAYEAGADRKRAQIVATCFAVVSSSAVDEPIGESAVRS
ncbi:hypothetical protein J3A65_004678 [Rhizobium sp. PvP014]|nr:hypothetical protein [Rhizobium sp. PvP014]MBP2532078.1 hypothetical protein [Rhizobium sp. PvP099]